MREKYVEQSLIKAVRQSGGLAMKLISPGFNGVPDRLLLFMGGKVAFCEVKAPGQKPRPLQVHRMEQLRELGFRVYVIDGVEQIGEMMEELTKMIPEPERDGGHKSAANLPDRIKGSITDREYSFKGENKDGIQTA